VGAASSATSAAHRKGHADPHERARALHTAAVAAGRYGHAARAIRTLRKGLDLLDRECADRTDCRLLTAELLLSLAVNEAEVHGVDRGREVLGEAREVLRELDEPALQLRMHNNHALMATRAGDLTAAGDESERALTLLAHASPHDRVYTLLNSGNIRLYRGELPAAQRLFERAVAAARADGIADGEFRALHNLGYVEFLAGNLPAALAAMDAAAEIDVEISRGIWALDRARILVEAGLLAEADDTLSDAGRMFAAARTAQDLGEVEVARAECALLRGDAPAARRFAARARDRFRRRGNELWMRLAELVLLQADLAAGRPGSRLAPVAARLQQQLVDSGQPSRARAAALVEVEALLAAGRLAAAEQAATRIEPAAEAASISSRVHARYVRASLASRRGDHRTARREIRAGLGDLASYQAGFGSIDLRTASAVHGRRLVQLDIAMAIDEGRPEAVLAAVERGRAVSTRIPPVRPPSDEESAALLAELRQTVEALRAGAPNAAELLSRRADLVRRVRGRAWSLPGAGRAAQAAQTEAIGQAAAAADIAFLAFVHEAAVVHVVVAAGGSFRLHQLGPWAQVESLIRRARADFDVLALERVPEPLRDVAAASVQRSLRELDELLLAPLGLAGQPLVVAPTGLLATVPWAALPSRRRVPVTVAPSGTAWLAASAANGAKVQQATRRAALAGPGLRRADAEAHAVAAAWRDSDVVDHARRADVEAAFAAASVVHIAAHGQHQVENPLFSSLRLADGPLFAWEIDRTPAHVVLSACELGAATVRPGDEALGLTSVLLHLGTASVISSVARVSDHSAEQTMAGYHARLARGADSATALAEALADAADGARNVPAPFVNFGSAWRAPGPAAAHLEPDSPLA
jgi:CHAT domain-containing protein